jgi:hypothetical protein
VTVEFAAMTKMDFPQIEDVQFEFSDERLKVMLPAERNWIYLALYSVLLLVWIGVTVWMVGLLVGMPIGDLPTAFLVVWLIILLVWAYVWYRLGRHVWRYWQYYVAKKEILFVDDELFIVRRPLSLLGVTDAYAMEHAGSLYYSDKYKGIAFDYGSRAGVFARGLKRGDAERLISTLNGRFFPAATEAEAI